MSSEELRIENRIAYFRKAISTPGFGSERVLARDSFEFAELWLQRRCVDALPYWRQAHAYYKASHHLSVQSSPLTSYYCFLNAVKALLKVKKQKFSDRHGISGNSETSKRALKNEKITLQPSGVISALSKYLEEPEGSNNHTLTEALSNLPFIHRAYRYTFRSHPEMFIPIKNVTYRKNSSNYVYLTAEVEGKWIDGRNFDTLPKVFEQDKSYEDKFVIRPKKNIKWFKHGSQASKKDEALLRLQNYHRKFRQYIVYISSSPDLWYLKREPANTRSIKRYGLTLIFAAMHRLSELARYDPKGLMRYLNGRENWLLTEFIELSPNQFIDELVCEMTSLEFNSPGIRL